MVNSARLIDSIEKSGLKKGFLAKELGIGTVTFWRKVNGKADFKVGEVVKLCDLLGIQSDGEKARIFLRE